jgi:hypothetical protein
MSKKRDRARPRAMRIGATTPVVLFTTQQKKKMGRLINKRLMRDRKRYPEVRGKVVDYIRHSVDDGTLAVTVAFKDQTAFFLRYACRLFPAAVDLSDWKTGNMEMIREYMKPIST